MVKVLKLIIGDSCQIVILIMEFDLLYMSKKFIHFKNFYVAIIESEFIFVIRFIYVY